jgi:hypothetical protein
MKRISTIEEASAAGMRIKLAAHTIVLQGADGNMKGMLRGFRTYEDYQRSPRRHWDLFNRMKQQGIPLMHLAQSLVFGEDDTPYLFVDDYAVAMLRDFEPELNSARERFYLDLEAKGVRVLHFPRIINARPVPSVFEEN